MEVSSSSSANSSPAKIWSFMWVIENFANSSQKSFHSECSDANLFQLELYPDDIGSVKNQDQILIILRKYKTANDDFAIQFKIALLNDKGGEFNTLNGNVALAGNNNWPIACGVYCISRSYLLDNKNGLLPEGKLTILCEITKLSQLKDSADTSAFRQNSLASLSQYHETLLKTGKLSDVIIAYADREFRGHKLILSSQSPVFEAMFQDESQQCRVDIADYSTEVVEELLRFIYTGQVKALNEVAIDLYSAADRYQVESLKAICLNYLVENLSVRSVSDVYELAGLYNLEEIKKTCTGFILYHPLDMSDEEWEILTAARAKYAAELFINHYQDCFDKT